jgi:hypothetical protein
MEDLLGSFGLALILHTGISMFGMIGQLILVNLGTKKRSQARNFHGRCDCITGRCHHP